MAPGRAGGLQIRLEKSLTGQTEDVASSGMGTDRPTILHKSKEAYL